MVNTSKYHLLFCVCLLVISSCAKINHRPFNDERHPFVEESHQLGHIMNLSEVSRFAETIPSIFCNKEYYPLFSNKMDV